MFALDAGVLQPLANWLDTASGKAHGLFIRMTPEFVYFQVGDMTDATMLLVDIPRAACSEWTAPAGTVTHLFKLGTFRRVVGAVATTVRITLPNERLQDCFVVELLSHARELSILQVNALEQMTDFLEVDAYECSVALSATFQHRELCSALSWALGLGNEYYSLSVSAPATLQFRATGNGKQSSSLVTMHAVHFGSVDSMPLFTGDAPADDPGDGSAPRTKRQAGTVAREPNTIFELRSDPAFEKVLFSIKSAELINRTSFSPTVKLSVLQYPASYMLRFDYTMLNAPLLRIRSLMGTAIGEDD
ncbi:MAG TPA: hypothetical protein VM915_08300 [Verrucomicrobiae bacterium]|nr:hypothetical protein [Verrucomicrobiae bacterium]